MNDMLALGIDVGTSGVRVVATNAEHDVIALAQTNLPAPINNGQTTVQDASLWWLAVSTALDQLRTMISFERIAAICIDGTSGTIVAVDRNGQPLAPASMYNDPSAKAAADVIAKIAPPETAAHGATSPLGRAIALQKMPGVVGILHQADWIMSQFTGAFDTSDENNALKTGYDPALRVWPQWIEAAGFDMKLLPRVVAVGEIVGIVLPAIQIRFGLGKNTKVVSGTTDGCAAFLATGANNVGDGVTSLGTTMVIKLLSDRPIFAPQFGIYSHRIGDLWLPGGASNSGGAALLKYFNAEQISALEPSINVREPTGQKYYPLSGIGERFPVYDPHMQSRAEPRPASDAAFLQGLLEGIADVEVLAYQRMAELSAPTLQRVFTVGGGAKNKPWGEIRAQKLKVPMEIPASDQAAVGAARLAWKGLVTDRNAKIS